MSDTEPPSLPKSACGNAAPLLRAPAGIKIIGLLIACATLVSGGSGCRRQASAEKGHSFIAHEHVQQRAAEYTIAYHVLLGSPRLTSGIPGSGPLQISQVQAWLGVSANHSPLQVTLPLGLDAADEDMIIPEDNPLTRAKIELGRQLFFDRRLFKSANAKSCGDCHIPSKNFSDPNRNNVPRTGLHRAAPALLNRILGRNQYADGRAESLEAQAIPPYACQAEAMLDPEHVVAFLKENLIYNLEFGSVFEEVNMESVGMALAAFERVLVTGPSPVDVYLAKQRQTAPGLSTAERARLAARLELAADVPEASVAAIRGMKLFNSDRVNCRSCHTGPNFSDEKFHNNGIRGTEDEDFGRFAVTGEEADRFKFRTPSLRNVAANAPYMHGGGLGDLLVVLAHYDQPTIDAPNLDPQIRPLGLSQQEIRDLLAFLESLTGAAPVVETGRLPR